MAPRSPLSILVIDDDRPFARSVQILLEDEGRHHVAVAPSADHALAALRATTKVDLLIVDLAILDEHGVRLNRAIRDRPGKVAVIVMTAHEAALDAARSRLADAAGFLNKPIDPNTLLAMVSSAKHNPPLKFSNLSRRIGSAEISHPATSPQPSSANPKGESE